MANTLAADSLKDATVEPRPSASEMEMARTAARVIGVNWKEPRIKHALLALIRESKTQERERLRSAFAWRGSEP